MVFKSFNVVKNLKKSDSVERQMPPFNTTIKQCSYPAKFTCSKSTTETLEKVVKYVQS